MNEGTPRARRSNREKQFIERLEAEFAGKKGPKLGALEEKLISILTKTAADKFELIEQIYGTQIEFFTAENRLKNLMNRVRKRTPGLLVLREGKYQLEKALAAETAAEAAIAAAADIEEKVG